MGDAESRGLSNYKLRGGPTEVFGRSFGVLVWYVRGGALCCLGNAIRFLLKLRQNNCNIRLKMIEW